jgi:hypothetical protein
VNLVDVVSAPRRQWIVLASAWAVALAVVFLWLVATPAVELREQLKRAQFWSLEACVAVGLLLVAAIAPKLRPALDRRMLVTLAALVAFALALTLFVSPRTNRIYYDEQIYQNIGQNLADLRLAQMCNDGVVEYGRLQCGSGYYNKQPYAYPHLLSLIYRVSGVSSHSAFVVNAAVMALTVIAVYLAALLAFADRTVAFFSGLIVTLLPQQLLWSATAAVEPSASLACVVALAAAFYCRRSGTWLSLTLAGVASVYAAQFRPESLLIAPIVGLVVWPTVRQQLKGPHFWWVCLLCFALAAVHVGHLVSVRNEGWGTSEARFSLSYAANNMRANGPFFFADERFPLVATLLALAGLLKRGFTFERTTLLLYFALFFGVQLLFYAGSYNYGADVRYSLLTYPPLAILAGRGAADITCTLSNLRPSRRPWLPVTAALLFQFLWYLPVVRAVTEEAWAARADVRFAETLVPELQGNSYVLTHNPGMFHMWGVNAGQMAIVFNNPTYVDYLGLRYSRGVYLHWNFWCNVTVPEQQALCRMVRDQRQAVLVREYRERDQHFALYRLVTQPPRN